MARVKRSREEDRRIGVPRDSVRIDILERVISKLLAQSTVPAQDPDRQDLNKIKERLDQLDIDHPN